MRKNCRPLCMNDEGGGGGRVSLCWGLPAGWRRRRGRQQQLGQQTAQRNEAEVKLICDSVGGGTHR